MTNIISVDQQSGAMYTFVGTLEIKVYIRAGASLINYQTVSFFENYNGTETVGRVWYGQIVHNKHMAMIISNSSNQLFFQVHKYKNGIPPL